MKQCAILFFFLSISWGAFSQQDTINITPFQLTATPSIPAYKMTQFDSLSINNTENLAQLLSNNSTVFIKSYGGGSLATASFRGTGASHTKVQWNGINLNSPMNGQLDFALFPTFFFDNASIHYGASGLMDGNGALGGSIIMENTENFTPQFSTHVKQTVGSFGTYTTAAKGVFARKGWLLETKLYHNKSENDFSFTNSTQTKQPTENQTNAAVKQQGIQQAIYKKFKNSSLGTRVWFFDSNRDLPPTLLQTTSKESQTDRSFRALVEWKGMHNRFQYQVRSGMVKDALVYRNKSANIQANNNSYLYDNHINTTLFLNYNFELINRLNIRYENAKTDDYEKSHHRFNNSWFVGMTKKIKRFDLNVFNRLTMVGQDFKPFAPSLGVRYSLLKKENLFFKANAGINYNSPTFNDLYWTPGGNENLQPEQAKMSEVGFHFVHKTAKTSINAAATVFYTEVNNWIIWQPTEQGYWSPNNLKNVENKGIEGDLMLRSKLNKITFKQHLNYAYVKSINKKIENTADNTLNKQLIYVPFHQFNYTLHLHFKGYILHYNYNYTGKRFTSSDNNWYLPANFISNASVGKRFNVRKKTVLVASFRVNNIFNQAYQSIAYRPMPGRNYTIFLSINFAQ